MHDCRLPEDLIESVTKRRGRPYAFEALNPRTTALVVIDMQNAFVGSGGVPLAKAIVPNINRVAEALRSAGGTVTWIQSAVGDWPGFMSDVLGPKRAARMRETMVEGSFEHELWHELEVAPGDWRETKTRYSAFMPSACGLPDRLRIQGIDTVLIAGTMTNVCCESSARDAAMLDFRTIMVADANATLRDDWHLATLNTFHRSFGDVRTSEEVIRLIARAG